MAVITMHAYSAAPRAARRGCMAAAHARAAAAGAPVGLGLPLPQPHCWLQKRTHMSGAHSHGDSIRWMTASELAAAIHGGNITAVTALEALLAAGEALNPTINAIVVWDEQRALARAAEADAALARGESWGPLHGVPMTLKENINVAGLPSTVGFDTAAARAPAPDDEPLVELLMDAGAIIYGKTNLPIDLADWQAYNSVYGRTNNPWDLGRSPGGSSGGSSAAVSAGLSPCCVGALLPLPLLPLSPASSHRGTRRG